MGNTYGTTRSRPYSATYPPATQSAHTVRRWPTSSGECTAVSTSSPCGSALTTRAPSARTAASSTRARSATSVPVSRCPSHTSPPGSWRRHASSQTTRRSLSPVPEGSGRVIGKIAGCGMIMG